jgi:hypothetical protein
MVKVDGVNSAREGKAGKHIGKFFKRQAVEWGTHHNLLYPHATW